MRMMDELRNEWGIVYPFEENGMHNELLEALEIEEKPITTISTDAEEEVMAYTPLFDAEVAKGKMVAVYEKIDTLKLEENMHHIPAI